MALVKMKQLCFTDRTLYGVDEEGYVWYIELCGPRAGQWMLHGNPTIDERAKELNRIKGK